MTEHGEQTNAQRIEAIRARADALGKDHGWSWAENKDEQPGPSNEIWCDYGTEETHVGSVYTDVVANFIAAARTDIPWLITQLEARDREIGEWKLKFQQAAGADLERYEVDLQGMEDRWAALREFTKGLARVGTGGFATTILEEMDRLEREP